MKTSILMVVFAPRRGDRDNLEFRDWCLCSRTSRTPGVARPRHRVRPRCRHQVHHTGRTRAEEHYPLQAVAYYGKLAIHPAPLATFADLLERAAIGPIPGGWVIAAGIFFHGGWAVFALVTLRIEIASRRKRGSLIAMG